MIEPVVFSDARGFFLEIWNRLKFAEAGIDADFVQDNHSSSVKNTLRGLHYQLQNTQGKLVRVNLGTVFDVAVDIRRSSPTFNTNAPIITTRPPKDASLSTIPISQLTGRSQTPVS